MSQEALWIGNVVDKWKWLRTGAAAFMVAIDILVDVTPDNRIENERSPAAFAPYWTRMSCTAMNGFCRLVLQPFNGVVNVATGKS